MPRHVTRVRPRPRRRVMRRRAGRSYRALTSWSARKIQNLNASGKIKALTGFPMRMTVSLPYEISSRVTSGVLTGYDTVFKVNSIYDPEETGVGHQPRGFDQWALVYNKYRVGRVDVNLIVRQRGSHGIISRCLVNNEAAQLHTDPNLGEFPGQVYLGSTSSNVRPLQRRFRYYPHKVLGKTWKQYIADENTAALCTADPSELVYMHTITQQTDQVSTIDYEYEIQLVYRVTFFDHKNLASS